MSSTCSSRCNAPRATPAAGSRTGMQRCISPITTRVSSPRRNSRCVSWWRRCDANRRSCVRWNSAQVRRCITPWRWRRARANCTSPICCRRTCVPSGAGSVANRAHMTGPSSRAKCCDSRAWLHPATRNWPNAPPCYAAAPRACCPPTRAAAIRWVTRPAVVTVASPASSAPTAPRLISSNGGVTCAISPDCWRPAVC